MRLVFAPENKTLILKEITGGGNIRRRLSELGLVEGAELELLQSSGSGPVMVRLNGSKIGIGRGMAHQIEVEPAP